MKSNKDFSKSSSGEDSLRRAAKLDPMRRNGKERHQLFKSLNSSDSIEEDDEDFVPTKRESILDYMDPEED